MTSQGKLSLLTFYRSGPMSCPYLPGKIEQQLFTDLSGADAQARYDVLSQGGFRRSHHIAYRPSCRDCTACVPVRVVAGEFRTNARWRRIQRANVDLHVEDAGTKVSDEQYELFQRYLNSRHEGGDMARMSRHDYFEMVASSTVETSILEFRDPDGTLIGACLTDRIADGFSAVYSFFEPSLGKRSLGSFVILALIDKARAANLRYVYLGFWIEASRKMRYKSRFEPIEGFGPDGWRPLDEFKSAAGD
jgi:arginine-tRNA-protein transferase